MLVKQAVLLAAGVAKRTRPLTGHKPKALLPVLNKPILQHTLEQLLPIAGEAIVVVGYEAEQIRDYFGDRLGSLPIRYVTQSAPLGTGHAVLGVEELVDGNFLVLNGDDLFSAQDLWACAERRHCVLAQRVRDTAQFGVLATDGEYVSAIIEKPADAGPDRLVNTGVFHFERDIFDIFRRIRPSARGEYEITDVVRLLPAGNRLRYREVRGHWLPIGYSWDLLRVNRLLLPSVERDVRGTVEAGAELSGAVVVGPGARLRSGCRVIGPAIVGPHSIVEGGAVVGPGTVVGEGCRVGHGALVVGSLLMNRVHVGPGCRVPASILSDDVFLGDEVTILSKDPDRATVESFYGGQMVDTGLAELGAIVGQGTRLGKGATVSPGVKLSGHQRVADNAVLSADI